MATNLISEVELLEVFKNDPRTLKEITELTGIQQTRIHRLRKEGYAMWASEYLTLIQLYQLTDSATLANDKLKEAQLTLDKARIDAQKLIEEAQASNRANAHLYRLSEMETLVAKHYDIHPDLLRWRLADPKLKNLTLSKVDA